MSIRHEMLRELKRSPALYTGEQVRVWPKAGRHILAQYDHDTVVVYQAYRPSIGHHAVKFGTFGGGFSNSRMSWIKPNMKRQL